MSERRRILLLMAQAYFPHQAGGMQVVTRDLAREFAARGHTVAVGAALSFRGWAGLRAGAEWLRGGRRVARGAQDGLPLLRARRIGADPAPVLNAFPPDVVVVQSMDAVPIASTVAARGLPLVLCFHDAELHRLGGDPRRLPARFVATSSFTAAMYREAFGIESRVVPPPIREDAYRVRVATHGSVLFVNPVAEKGLGIALAVAASCPEIAFEFVESWVLRRGQRRALRAALAPLANVRLTPRQADMRPVYARSQILLAPSQWPEGWGRVASEAQVSGIPVLASRIGGLPEAVGDGGVLLPPDAPAAEWAAALRAMRVPARFAELSARARAHAARPEIGFARGVSDMLEEIEAAIAGRLPPAHGATATGLAR